MNYFELHLGDYEAATAHLSMLEDAAYCRMLRIYYRTEKPLPSDVAKVCRLVRANSKPERDAVQQVLDDFFRLEEDGWHQARADAEISAFKAGEPEREAKKANEETRLKRHREERAALFMQLTEAGQHAPWNIGTKELRALVAALQKAPPDTPPATKPATPATAPATPATATQTPDTIPHSPDTSLQTPEEIQGRRAPGAPAPVPAPAPLPPGAVGLALRRAGVNLALCSLPDPRIDELMRTGSTLDELEAVAREAVKKAISKPVPWIAATMAGRRREAAATPRKTAGRAAAPTADEQVAASMAKAQRVAAALGHVTTNGAQPPAAPAPELIDG